MYQQKSPLQTQLGMPSQATNSKPKQPAAGIPTRTQMPGRQGSPMMQALAAQGTDYSQVQNQHIAGQGVPPARTAQTPLKTASYGSVSLGGSGKEFSAEGQAIKSGVRGLLGLGSSAPHMGRNNYHTSDQNYHAAQPHFQGNMNVPEPVVQPQADQPVPIRFPPVNIPIHNPAQDLAGAMGNPVARPGTPSGPAAFRTGLAPAQSQAGPLPAVVNRSQPDWSQVEADAEAAFESEVANDPRRQAMGIQQRQSIAGLQGAQARLAQGSAAQLGYTGAQMPRSVNEALSGRMAGFGDRAGTAQMNNVGMMGNVRGNQFNTGSTAYASGPLAQDVAPRQSSFSPERQAAIIAKMNDPSTPEGQAAMASRERMRANQEKYGNKMGQSPMQQAMFANYQERREDRRLEGLANRREFNQQRAAQQEQARMAQVQAANNPMNSPLMRQLMMSRPEVAASLMGSMMQQQTAMTQSQLQSQLGMAGIAQRQNEANLNNTLGMRQVEVDEGRVKSQEGIERGRMASQELLTKDEIAAKVKIAQDELAAADARLKAEMEAGRPSREARIARDKSEQTLNEIKADAAKKQLSMPPREQRFRAFASGELPMSEMQPSERGQFNQWLASQQGDEQVAPQVQSVQAPLDTAAATEISSQYSPLIQSVFGVSPEQLDSFSMSSDLMNRFVPPSGKPARPISDNDLSAMQQWAQSRSQLDETFDSKGDGDPYISELMELMFGDEPLTAQAVTDLGRRRAEDMRKQYGEFRDRQKKLPPEIRGPKY